MRKPAKIVTFIAMLMLLCFAAQAQQHKAYVITVNGVITSATNKYIRLGIEEAAANGAKVFIIKLDTPGGVLDATRSIVQAIFESPIPVAVYVSPQGAQAGSAGTFITLAADFAVMASGSNIGAAHPVMITGGDIEGDMREKTTNDTVGFMRAIAEKRGRNIEEAVLTVTESKSFSAAEALNAGLIDGVVNNDEALLLMLETSLELDSGLVIHEISPTFVQKFMFGLSNPNVLILLFFAAVLLFFLEFKMAGSFVFAGLGVVAVIFFLIGANLVPVNFLGILLILLGIGLLIAEIFITSFGLLTLGGLVALVAGALLTFDTEKTQGVSVSIGLIAVIVAVIGAGIIFIGRLIVKDMKKKPVVGLSSMVGKVGTVKSWSGNKGQVYVFGELWFARADGELEVDQTVKVTAVDNITLTVVPDDTEIPD